MRVIAVKTIREFWEEYPEAETGLKHWYERIGKASYRNPAEVAADFKGSDYVGNTRIVFNIAKINFGWLQLFGMTNRFVGSSLLELMQSMTK